MDKEQIQATIFRAVDEVNLQLPPEKQVVKSLDTPLLAKAGGTLDSLGLVNFVLTTEEFIDEDFGIMVNLADQKAISHEPSPYTNIAALADYVVSLLEEKPNGRQAV